MKFVNRTLLIILSAGMILSTGVGSFVNSEVVAKEKKSKKGNKGSKIPYAFRGLDLSKDQIAKIGKLIPDGLADLLKERSDAQKKAGDDADKKKTIGKQFSKKIKPLAKEWVEKAKALLNDDQIAKLAELSKKRSGKRKKK